MTTYIFKFKIGDKGLSKKIKANSKAEAVKVFDNWVKPVIESIDLFVEPNDKVVDDMIKMFGMK